MLSVNTSGCSSPVERSVRDREVGRPIRPTPTHSLRSVQAMNRNEVVKFLILRTIGNFLVLFAIYGVIATFGPALYFEAQYQVIKARGIHFTVRHPQEVAQKPSQVNVLTGPKEQDLIPFDPSFSIVIPKIGASANVIPNVDPSDPNIFLPALMEGVAHAKGTVFPGQPGNIYLFAHSTDNFWDVGRYNAVFYLLKDLTPGDEIVLFYNRKRFNYKVIGSQIVDPSEVSYLIQKPNKNSPQMLILQTCWPPGTAWQRLMVFATPE